jgi:hypothetical protein
MGSRPRGAVAVILHFLCGRGKCSRPRGGRGDALPDDRPTLGRSHPCVLLNKDGTEKARCPALIVEQEKRPYTRRLPQ